MSIAELADDLGKRIREHRTRLNLSQIETAARLGVSERTIQNWESGLSFPWPRHRRVIAQFLNEDA